MSANAGTSVPLRVLIVEDNRDARTTMRLLLTMAHGYAVHEAADGASGVQAALDARPDVALIDLGLPDVDGCEVAARSARRPCWSRSPATPPTMTNVGRRLPASTITL
ncbi:MAG TPA: response regulator [Burkholderiales bacterium]|nr:response regulator [Burkholderiales bacterium]